MSTNIMINKKHIISPANNKFQYHLPTNLVLGPGDKIAISKMNIFYSWFNVSANYGNNKVQILWWDDSGQLTVPYTWTIPDGYYTLSKLNEALLAFCVQNKLYLISADGKSFVYLIEFRVNEAAYKIEVLYNSLSQTYTDGTTVPSTYTDWFILPAGCGWIPPVHYEIPQLIIPSTSTFGLLIGQPIGAILPAQSALPTITSTVAQTLTVGSTITPELEPSTSFFITCNICDNSMSIPNNLLDSFTLTSDAQFGQIMNPLASERVWAHCKSGTYSDIIIEIFDQDFHPLYIEDPNILMILSIIH